MKSEACLFGTAFVAFVASAVLWMLPGPEGESQMNRSFCACATSAAAAIFLLATIRAIIREELERKDSTP